MKTVRDMYKNAESFIAWEAMPDDWYVLPCARNRDSDVLTESNWHVAL